MKLTTPPVKTIRINNLKNNALTTKDSGSFWFKSTESRLRLDGFDSIYVESQQFPFGKSNTSNGNSSNFNKSSGVLSDISSSLYMTSQDLSWENCVTDKIGKCITDVHIIIYSLQKSNR